MLVEVRVLIRSTDKTKLYPQNPLAMMRRVYRYVLPEVRARLQEWRQEAEQMPDEELRRQAIASMTDKEFHCIGGAVYAAADPAWRHVLVPLIVALQTISDYLDNLCDRSTSLDPHDFRMLHQAMLDAVAPDAPVQDYYAFRKEREDGGYLAKLVTTCQACVRQLPSYPLVAESVRELVSYYCDLQVYKHIRHDLREGELLCWWELHSSKFPDLSWNEFAAATGSTLGMFMLFLAASDKSLQPEEASRIREAYFPYVCGLHILLDYLIDQEEDRLGGDLNFCNYYREQETAVRMEHVVLEARSKVAGLESPAFHRMIIEGLIALYLSDPKVKSQEDVKRIKRTLMKNSPVTRLFFWANSVWIRLSS